MRCTPLSGTLRPEKKSRMSLRVTLYGSPRILRNGKWHWLSPDWVIVNTKKMDSGFA